MAEPIAYAALVADLWRVARVIEGVPIDEAYEHARHAKYAPEWARASGVRRDAAALERDLKLLRAYHEFRTALSLIDNPPRQG